ncbi:hypothetical protein SK3146_04009 [Paenibacillus konkukensis]|uniref:DUF6385 domain-containing protein n=2 Tax=Paenibacillus konkukensis TaxID=2020716 RepID=A0ABY4RSN2_9BACL|nr:hypothetical protein SK3146_04009 [Paenibacillus konkukensis]
MGSRMDCDMRKRKKAKTGKSKHKCKNKCRILLRSACAVCLRKKKRKCRHSCHKEAPHTFLNIQAGGEFTVLPVQDVSQLTMYSYGIVNRGEHPIVAKIQISPNRHDFADDVEEVIDSGATLALVPVRFLYYARVAVRAEDPDQSSMVDVYFQARTVA